MDEEEITPQEQGYVFAPYQMSDDVDMTNMIYELPNSRYVYITMTFTKEFKFGVGYISKTKFD